MITEIATQAAPAIDIEFELQQLAPSRELVSLVGGHCGGCIGCTGCKNIVE
jgi:hypothetical protein